MTIPRHLPQEEGRGWMRRRLILITPIEPTTMQKPESANKQRPVMPKQKSKRVKFASPEKKDTKFDNLMKRVASVLDRPRKCLFVVALLI